MNRTHSRRSMPLLIATAAMLLLGPATTAPAATAQTDGAAGAIRHDLDSSTLLADLNEAFSEVAQAVVPSVVHIQVAAKVSPNGGGRQSPHGFRLPMPFNEDDWQWFGPDAAPDGQQQDDQWQQYDVPQPLGNGCGWVYDADGHLVTNYHVVSDADQITVRFDDGREYAATVVGTDPKTDVAVLKIDASDLQPAALATEPVKQGELVFAFGSPFGNEFSMSQGIVSAKGREIELLIRSTQGYEDFIQTDAAINPGNSGGPLVNIHGRLVGMNTAIASKTGDYNGIGYAIPVDMLVGVVDQLIAHGRVTRGYLGIYIDDLTPKMAKSYGYEGKGVLVQNPVADSPAEKAGIQTGDIIASLGDVPVESVKQLRAVVAATKPGTEIQIEIIRDGERMKLPVTVAELDDQAMPTLGRGDDSADRDDGGNVVLRKLGFTRLNRFTREMADQYDVPFTPGVLVSSVRRNSVAWAAAIKGGTLITHVANQPVESVGEMLDAIAALDPDTGIRLRLKDLRTNIVRVVLLELPEE